MGNRRKQPFPKKRSTASAVSRGHTLRSNATKVDSIQGNVPAEEEQPSVVISKPIKKSILSRIYKEREPGEVVTRNRKRRWRPGTVVRREILKYQKTTELFTNCSTFKRYCKEILYSTTSMGVRRMQKTALDAIRHAAEAYLIDLLRDGYSVANHAKRITIMVKDLQLVRQIRPGFGGIQHVAPRVALMSKPSQPY